MKVPYRWLQDYVEIDTDLQTLVDALIMTGNAVEDVIRPREDISHVVAGRIVALEKHPDADKLQICQIDVGEEEPVQIVTGADNVFVGALVPVALHNSHLPNGMHIKKGKLRGVASNGMLCSGEELCLKESDYPGAGVYGILILREGDAVPGQDMREVLFWDGTVLDFEVGANRPDCLSILGNAREAAAALRKTPTLPHPTFHENAESVADYVQVRVEAPDLCPRYMARAVKNVHIAPSPRWMQQRLAEAGVRPINNIVDITNFVMLEMGQPMHAFDAKTVRGGQIVVRRAHPGEQITTLDGKLRDLGENNLLICDAEGPIGVAGVMGGENSEIESDTATVIFESAKFMYGNIRKTSRELGLATEASMRYSKGIDATVAEYALNRACQLVEMLGAGEVVGGCIDLCTEDLSPKAVRVTPAYINARLGTQLSTEEMVDCLERAYIKTVRDGEELVCEIPRFRTDIDGKADLSEEVARLYGYDNIPEHQAAVHFMDEAIPDPDAKRDLMRSYLSAQGYFECVTYSFMGMQDLDKLGVPAEDALRQAVRIINPLGDDRAYMRTTLLPAMLEIVAANLNHKEEALRLYELSRVFLPEQLPLDGKLPEEHASAILAMTEDAGDFYALKGDVENILRVAYGQTPRFASGGADYWHPGRKAVIYLDGRPVGEMGELHPTVAGRFGLSKRVTLACIDLAKVSGAKETHRYAPIPRFPAIERDIALVVGETVEVGALMDCIRAHGGEYLEEVTLFDIYRSAALGADKKSVAFALRFRSAEGTLSDDQIAAGMNGILSALRAEFGAELRA